MKTESIREFLKKAMPEFKIAGKLKRVPACKEYSWEWKCLREYVDEENTHYAILLNQSFLMKGLKVLAISDSQSYMEIIM